MSRAVVVLLLLILSAPVLAQTRGKAKSAAPKTAAEEAPSMEKRAIAAAKQASVKSLDAALPEQPFEAWFQSLVGAATKVEWEMNDCGEQTGDPKTTPADVPLCAQASAKISDDRSVVVMIGVGSSKKGISGAPTVFSILMERHNAFDDVNSLHDLASAIARKPETE